MVQPVSGLGAANLRAGHVVGVFHSSQRHKTHFWSSADTG